MMFICPSANSGLPCASMPLIITQIGRADGGFYAEVRIEDLLPLVPALHQYFPTLERCPFVDDRRRSRTSLLS